MMGTGMALPMGGAVAVNQDQRKGSLAKSSAGDHGSGRLHSKAEYGLGLSVEDGQGKDGLHQVIERQAVIRQARHNALLKLRTLHQGFMGHGGVSDSEPEPTADDEPEPTMAADDPHKELTHWYGRRKGEIGGWYEASLPNGRRNYHQCEPPALLLLDSATKQLRLDCEVSTLQGSEGSQRVPRARTAEPSEGSQASARERWHVATKTVVAAERFAKHANMTLARQAPDGGPNDRAHMPREWLQRAMSDKGFERPHVLTHDVHTCHPHEVKFGGTATPGTQAERLVSIPTEVPPPPPRGPRVAPDPPPLRNRPTWWGNTHPTVVWETEAGRQAAQARIDTGRTNTIRGSGYGHDTSSLTGAGASFA